MSVVLAATSPSEPQRERSLRPPTEGLVLGLIGARWATFTAKTRPKSTSPNERGAFGGFAKGVSQLSRAPTDIDQLRGGSPAYARGLLQELEEVVVPLEGAGKVVHDHTGVMCLQEGHEIERAILDLCR